MFTVEQFHDLVRLLEEQPEWRAELRRLVLTEELLDLPRAVQTLVEVQQRSEARLDHIDEQIAALVEAQQRTAEAQQRSEARLDRIDEQIAALVEAQQRTAEAQQRTEEALAEFRRQAEQRFDKIEGDTGRLKGFMLEERYRARPWVYFKDILRRARTLEDRELADLLETAVEGGQLTRADLDEIAATDVVVRGVSHQDDAPVYLVAEVSWGVGPSDVKRAARRAQLLARLGTPTIPVAAGDWVTPAGSDQALEMEVWLVTDGRARLAEEG